MKYLKVLKSVALLFAVLLLNSVTFAAHTSAMPVMAHDMAGMNHKANDNTSCATQCRTAVFNKEDAINSRYDVEDDEPVVPFYSQNQAWLFSDTHATQKLYADSIKPPPKIPIYILYGVFRV